MMKFDDEIIGINVHQSREKLMELDLKIEALCEHFIKRIKIVEEQCFGYTYQCIMLHSLESTNSP